MQISWVASCWTRLKIVIFAESEVTIVVDKAPGSVLTDWTDSRAEIASFAKAVLTTIFGRNSDSAATAYQPSVIVSQDQMWFASIDLEPTTASWNSAVQSTVIAIIAIATVAKASDLAVIVGFVVDGKKIFADSVGWRKIDWDLVGQDFTATEFWSCYMRANLCLDFGCRWLVTTC